MIEEAARNTCAGFFVETGFSSPLEILECKVKPLRSARSRLLSLHVAAGPQHRELWCLHDPIFLSSACARLFPNVAALLCCLPPFRRMWSLPLTLIDTFMSSQAIVAAQAWLATLYVHIVSSTVVPCPALRLSLHLFCLCLCLPCCPSHACSSFFWPPCDLPWPTCACSHPWHQQCDYFL